MAESRAPFPITYPDLPITERRQELLDVIEANQVVVVAGETGSGKSTQLPKFCLELGRGQNGQRIGHTQPRRIAARSIAERLASELKTELGEAVGYAVRFTDEVGPNTLVKVMTDGILLNEIQRDRDLMAYDTIIVDEAHERSLNIDFLLGHLRRVIERRADLKVIITSATIDTARFSAHFGDAPIVEVSGRTYPVEIRYRPLDTDAWGDSQPVLDQPAAVCEAVGELFKEGPGDILAFFAGERDIRDAEEALLDLDLPNTEIVPLYARLTAAEQHRVFAKHKNRRIILSTNVAETSLTVPGIHYVIDSGMARISRFNRRTKVQRLPIEPISQASASQRSGRCGRLGPGIAIRLYGEDDFANRDEFTEPEIQRTSLAAVILRMKAARLGEIDTFPFVDPPDTRAISDGLALLRELGAIDDDANLTSLGRRLDRLPVDPRIGRIVLAGVEQHCVQEVLIIAAGMSVRDPRERPRGQEQQAAEMHKRFRVEGSDLLSWLKLWDYINEQRSAGSSSRFRRQCRKEYLNYPRIREWQEVHSQLRRACRDIGVSASGRATSVFENTSADSVHKAILTGLLAQIGQFDRETKEFKGTRGTRFAVSPASVLFKVGPKWVVAADVVETTRTWAHSAAKVDPDWITTAGAHLVKYSYGEPWWDIERGAASVLERAVLLGLVIYDDQPVQLSRIDEGEAREMFIRHALVEGDWHGRHDFVKRNHERIREILDLESRNRRADLLVGDEDLIDWFGERLPDHITGVAAFDAWWRRRRKKDPHFLDLRIDDLLDDQEFAADDFPSTWPLGDVALHINYAYEPGSPNDGVTIDVPPNLVARLDPVAFEWHVPGRRAEIVEHLVRKLPKPLRRQLIPIPDTVEAIMRDLPDERRGSMVEAVRQLLMKRAGASIAVEEMRADLLEAHLVVRFRLVDGSQDMLVTTEISELKAEVASQHHESLQQVSHPVETTGQTSWTFGELPVSIRLGEGQGAAYAYPAIVDEGATVGVRLVATNADRIDTSWSGVRRLLRLHLRSPARAIRHLMTDELKLGLATGPYPDTGAWFEDCIWCAIDPVIQRNGLPQDEPAWNALLADTRDSSNESLEQVVVTSTRILTRSRTIDLALGALRGDQTTTVTDATEHHRRLIYPGVLSAAGMDRLGDIDRYLAGLELRIDRASMNVQRDHLGIVVCRRIESEWASAVRDLGMSAELEDLGWLLQEFRVATFAQSIGAKGPVSEKRIRSAIRRIRQAQ